jgi:hypothetical protein
MLPAEFIQMAAPVPALVPGCVTLPEPLTVMLVPAELLPDEMVEADETVVFTSPPLMFMAQFAVELVGWK